MAYTYKGVAKIQRQIEIRMSKEAKAYFVFIEAGLTPLEPFINVDQKWKSECQNCGLIVSPRYADVYGGRGGCKPCGTERTRLSQDEAFAEAKRYNIEPLEPYENSTKPWKCKCFKCGEVISPSLHNLRAGHGCINCQVSAFKHSVPAYLYLIHHEEYTAFKIGVGNYDSISDRIESFKKSGWDLLFRYPFEKGSQAMKVEKIALKWIRKERKLPAYLSNEYFKHGGASETFGDETITELEVKDKIIKIIKGLQV